MYIKQLFVLLGVLTLGYAISLGFHLPLPSNVLAMLILFLALVTGMLKLSAIEDVADFIIKHLPIFFIAPTVGFMKYFGLFQQSFFQIMVPLLGALIVGFAVAGIVTQSVIAIQHKNKKGSEE